MASGGNSLVLRAGQHIVAVRDNPILCKMASEAVEHAVEIANQDDLIANPAFEAGESCFATGDITGAIRNFSLAAERGHVIAQLRLGGIYLEGVGSFKDLDAALHWFIRAAAQGEARAQLKLGWMHEAGLGVRTDNRRAVYWYRVAAEAGNPEAQFNIGVKYDNGEGVEHNPQEAVRWFLLAAEQGLADARYFVAQALENGDGIEASINEAMDWYFLASEQGHMSAKRRLWSLYREKLFIPEGYAEAVFIEKIGRDLGQEQPYFFEYLRLKPGYIYQGYEEIFPEDFDSEGDGHTAEDCREIADSYRDGSLFEVDLPAACYWYEKSINLGDTDALISLARILQWSREGIQDRARAIELFSRAAALGNSYAMYCLGFIFDRGQGVKRSTKTAFRWFSKAVCKGSANALSELGNYYTYGKHPKTNFPEAVKLYKRAIASGIAQGNFQMGLLTAQGLGVDRDLEVAKEYFEAAAVSDGFYAQQLSDFYRDGKILPRDDEMARYWQEFAETNFATDELKEVELLSGDLNGANRRSTRLQQKRVKMMPIKGLFD
jgi:TPR repeat protein